MLIKRRKNTIVIERNLNRKLTVIKKNVKGLSYELYKEIIEESKINEKETEKDSKINHEYHNNRKRNPVIEENLHKKLTVIQKNLPEINFEVYKELVKKDEPIKNDQIEEKERICKDLEEKLLLEKKKKEEEKRIKEEEEEQNLNIQDYYSENITNLKILEIDNVNQTKNDNGLIMLTTVDKLIEEVTLNSNELFTFMLTYRSILSPKELIDKLKIRFFII
jgi:hypothetical protein